MKIAVLLFGEYREFENTIVSLSPLIASDADFYVSTWDTSIQQKDSLNISLIEEITKDKIHSFLPNAFITISKPYQYGDVQTKMNFHWLTLAKMLRDSGNEYDVIIMKRMDTYIWEVNNTLFSHNSKDTMYIRNGIVNHRDRPELDDTTFVSSQESFLKFIENIPPLPKTFESHFGLYEIIVQQAGLDVQTIRGFSNCIIRPNMRPYITKDHDKNVEFLIMNWEKYNDDWWGA